MHPALLAISLALLGTPPAGAPSDKCFRMAATDERPAYLLLEGSGRYKRFETERGRIVWLDAGKWTRTAPSQYELVSDREAWALEVGPISVRPTLLRSVALMPALKNAIHAFLNKHATRTRFQWQEVSDIQVRGDPCPATDSYVCAGGCEGPWSYFVNTQPSALPTQTFSKQQLLDVAEAIDGYIARTDLDTFHFSVEQHLGRVALRWHESGVGWAFRRLSLPALRHEIAIIQDPPRHLLGPIAPSFLEPIPCLVYDKDLGSAPAGPNPGVLRTRFARR